MNQLPENLPLSNEYYNLVLMHRDAHFGGRFSIMIDYYEKGGKGACQDIEIKDIYDLAELEKQGEQNLAPLLLSGADAEKVAHSRDTYKKLRDLYNDESLAAKYPRLLADLILSEEEDPIEEIEAIVKEKGKIIPAILEIMRNDELSDPLFPGYGHAPALAAKCLGRIGDKRAIYTLFQLIGEGDFDEEAMAIEALSKMGTPAKEFLLQVVKGRPLNMDNERAAIALLAFKDDPEVAKVCSQLLSDPDVKKEPILTSYLGFVCEDSK